MVFDLANISCHCKFFILAVLLLTLVNDSNSFHVMTTTTTTTTTKLSSKVTSNNSLISLQQAASSGNSNYDSASASSASSDNLDRRMILKSIITTAIGATGSAAALNYKQQQQQSTSLSSSTVIGNNDESSGNGSITSMSNKNRLLTLDQAFMVIEASCDRRFLHAVVSSDYRFMYRGISKEDSRYPATIISDEPSDLLLPSTYGGSMDAANFFHDLDIQMIQKEGKPIGPSNGHLATTSIDSAKQWGGYAASIWPLVAAPNDDGNNNNNDSNVHFAWLEQGGEFWPTPAGAQTLSSSSSSSVSVIVDGIDCGRLSLEDALERENSEIMFRADRYLAIPVRMEEQLLSKLKSSFII